MVRSLPMQKCKKQDTNITGQVLLHGVSHSLRSSSTSPAHAELWSVFCHHPRSTTMIWWGTAFSTLSIYKFSKLFYLSVIKN